MALAVQKLHGLFCFPGPPSESFPADQQRPVAARNRNPAIETKTIVHAYIYRRGWCWHAAQYIQVVEVGWRRFGWSIATRMRSRHTCLQIPGISPDASELARMKGRNVRRFRRTMLTEDSVGKYITQKRTRASMAGSNAERHTITTFFECEPVQ